MSDLDLREAVSAAAEYQFGLEAARLGIDAEDLGSAWDTATPAVKHAYWESVRAAVVGAAPVIEAQVREQVAAKIEAHRRDAVRASLIDARWQRGMTDAARIARSDS